MPSQICVRQSPRVPPSVATVHGPLPMACPQTSSLSHDPERQRSDTPAAQVPLLGMFAPVAARSAQLFVVVLHHWAVVQSASTLHPPARTQVPFFEQAIERQNVLALPALQGPWPFA